MAIYALKLFFRKNSKISSPQESQIKLRIYKKLKQKNKSGQFQKKVPENFEEVDPIIFISSYGAICR